MAVRYRVLTLESSGGETATLPTSGVTCIVGGNNAGKSQLLRDIFTRVHTSGDEVAPATLNAVRVERPTGDAAEVDAWLRARAYRTEQSPERANRYAAAPGEHGLTVSEFRYWFDADAEHDPYLGNIAEYFVKRTSAGSLSEYAAGAIAASSYGQANSPLSRLLRNGDLEDELSALTTEVFGHGLVLDRINPDIRLRVGSVGVPVPLLNRPTSEYAEAVAALPTLDAQGDGFRSFVGLALLIMAEPPNVLLVDEPEAFLHPGQARALGRWLAKRAASHDLQIVLATHDRDIVLGLIEGSLQSAVTFVRLNREANVTHMTQLSPSQVQDVWDQPVLRYSNVLQGLFHNRVVMCEADGDCRFYGAALDQVAIASGKRAVADDVLFVPAGGKSGVPLMAAALTTLGVEARAILDFDLLRSKGDLKRTVAALGAAWSPSLDLVYAEFVKAPNDRKLWDSLKKLGLAGLPAGSSYAAGKALIHQLRGMGLYIVPVGETEDFDKSVNVHGPAWVTAALAAKVHEASAVVEFVKPILEDI